MTEQAGEQGIEQGVEFYNEDSPDQLIRERAVCMARDCKVRKIYKVLQECEKRIASKSYTAETCHQETVDWVEALDHCIHDKAFSKLA